MVLCHGLIASQGDSVLDSTHKATHGKASTWGGRVRSTAPPPGAVGSLAVEDTHVPSETD